MKSLSWQRLSLPFFGSLLLFNCFSTTAGATPIILDAELDTWFRTLAAPLQPHLPHTADARFVLVPDDTLNAYVDSEKVVHLHSGLILQAKTAAEIQGVLAHEMGHIAAQHLYQMEDTAKYATLAALAGAVLGIGAAAAGGGQAAGAIMASSQAGALAGLLSHSRQQEAEADQRGLTALHAAGLPARPLVTMLSHIRLDAQLSYGSPPPYLLTHPLPAERMAFLEAQLAADPVSPTLTPALQQALSAPEFARIQAKILALCNTPAETLRHYPGTDETSLYARAIAYSTQGRNPLALSTLAPLLAHHPTDPFYLETRGLLYLDAGDLPRAQTDLSRLLAPPFNQKIPEPSQLLWRFELAEVYRAQNNPAAAQPLYQAVTRAWPEWGTPWHMLSIVEGQLGLLINSHLDLTEEALDRGDQPEAAAQLGYAKGLLRQTPNPSLAEWAATLKQRLHAAE